MEQGKQNFKRQESEKAQNLGPEFANAFVFLNFTLFDAGLIAKDYFEKKKISSWSKGGVDIVTEADLKIDQFLREKISKAYPTHQILTEETASQFKGKIDQIRDLWIVDPLDGTVNFSCHDPHFAVSVAYVRFGKTKIAAIRAPLFNEFYFARDDKRGTYFDGQRMKISPVSDLKQSVVRADWSTDLSERPKTAEAIRRVCGEVRMLNLKCCASLDLARLARGDYQAYFHFGLKPWDFAAAAFLVEKAGGVVVKPDGSPFSLDCGGILAGNAEIVEKLQKILDF
jgi:myo-inositol-1(or 4)-monophosphatase